MLQLLCDMYEMTHTMYTTYLAGLYRGFGRPCL